MSARSWRRIGGVVAGTCVLLSVVAGCEGTAGSSVGPAGRVVVAFNPVTPGAPLASYETVDLRTGATAPLATSHLPPGVVTDAGHEVVTYDGQFGYFDSKLEVATIHNGPDGRTAGAVGGG